MNNIKRLFSNLFESQDSRVHEIAMVNYFSRRIGKKYISKYDDLQMFIESIGEWQKKTFPSANNLSKIYHLVEEIIELKDAITSSAYDGPRNHSVRMEYADCFLLLFGSAISSGFSLDDIIQAMKEKMKINKRRSWDAPDENGVVRHLEPSQTEEPVNESKDNNNCKDNQSQDCDPF